MACLALIAPLLLASVAGSTLEASVRGETRAAASQGSGGSLQPSLDFEVDPRADLHLTWPTAALAVAYAPLATVPTAGSPPVRLLQQAELSLEGQASADVHLYLHAQGSYGDADLSPVAQAATDPAVPIQSLPAVTTIHYLSSQTSAGLDAVLHRHLRLSLSAGWVVSGGIDVVAQQTMPLLRGPLAEVALAVTASRLDVLTTRVLGSSSLFTTGVRASVATAEEDWGRLLSASWTLRLAAGAGVSDIRGSSLVAPGLHWLPVAEAGLAYKPNIKSLDLRGGLSLRAAPIVDRITSEVYERVDGRLAASWDVSRALKLTGQVSAGVVASGTRQGNTIAALEATASFASGVDWAFSVGLRAAHQTMPSSFDEVGLFVDFAAQTRKRF